MALGYQPTRTIFVELGHLRPISDLAGRNVIRLDGTVESLHALAGRLQAAGCLLNRTGPGYLDASRFSGLSAFDRGSGRKVSEEAGGITGALLAVRLSHEGASDYIFEVSNRGPVVLTNVHWSLPQNASNWRLRTNVLHEYPIKSISSGEIVRVPAMIGTGGPSTVVVQLVATAPNGENYVVDKRLSINSSGDEWK
jgi:hypothetical protein